MSNSNDSTNNGGSAHIPLAIGGSVDDYKLPPELKARWLEALRSGRYRQGGGAMRSSHPDGDLFCCLGVLCDIVDPDGWGDEYAGAIPHYSHVAYPHSLVAPDGIFKAVGPERRSVAFYNDDGKTFAEIADLIEESF